MLGDEQKGYEQRQNQRHSPPQNEIDERTKEYIHQMRRRKNQQRSQYLTAQIRSSSSNPVAILRISSVYRPGPPSLPNRPTPPETRPKGEASKTQGHAIQHNPHTHIAGLRTTSQHPSAISSRPRGKRRIHGEGRGPSCAS